MSKSRKMHKNTLSHNDPILTGIPPLWKFVSMGQMDVQEKTAPYSVAVARYSALMRNKSPISYPWVQIVTHG